MELQKKVQNGINYFLLESVYFIKFKSLLTMLMSEIFTDCIRTLIVKVESRADFYL